MCRTRTIGVLQIFDEILVNAADNSQREKTMTELAVSVNPLTLKGNQGIVIEVMNDGKGIPVQMHPKEQVYIPALIFGQLLTGSNFDDLEVSVLKN